MSTPAVPAVPRSGGLPSLQRLIDHAVPGSLLELTPGDYGPARLTQPIVMDGHNATVWDDGAEPALELASSGLCVQNLRVRGRLECRPAQEPSPRLSSVRVHGHVQGLSPTDSLWELPAELNLGTLSAPATSLRCEVSVGEGCQIISRVSGINVVPAVLAPGIHEIKIEARDLMADSLLSGELEFLAAGVIRVVTLSGRVQPTGSKASANTAPIYSVSSAMRTRWQQKNQPVPLPRASAPAMPARLPIAPKQGANPLPTAGHVPAPRGLRRLPIYVLVDCSASNAGSPIEAIKQGIRQIHNNLLDDPLALDVAWLSVISFNDGARQLTPLTAIDQFTPPDLQAGGGRSLGAALSILRDSIEIEVIKTTPDQRGDWRPLAFLLISGNPTDTWRSQAAYFNQASPQPAHIVAVCCCAEVDVALLKQVTDTVLILKDMSMDGFKKFLNFCDPLGIDAPLCNDSLPMEVPATSGRPVLGNHPHQWNGGVQAKHLPLHLPSSPKLSSLFDTASEDADSDATPEAAMPASKVANVPDQASIPASHPISKPKREPAASRPALSKMFNEPEELP